MSLSEHGLGAEVYWQRKRLLDAATGVSVLQQSGHSEIKCFGVESPLESKYPNPTWTEPAAS